MARKIQEKTETEKKRIEAEKNLERKKWLKQNEPELQEEPLNQIAENLNALNNYTQPQKNKDDNMPNTDQSSVTDKISYTDKLSNTDKLEDIMFNYRGDLIDPITRISMIRCISTNSKLPFSARTFLTVILCVAEQTQFDISVRKLIKIVNLEERTFYRVRRKIEKICQIKIVNKYTRFNFSKLYKMSKSL